MSDAGERPFSFESDGLVLEGMLHEGTAPVVGLMLHPHPQYGGDMHNHVVVAVCRGLADRGATTLRFNFRGTGRSQGQFEDGIGGGMDARSAVRVLREMAPDARVVLAGYSFGALVAAGVGAELVPDALALFSPPLLYSPLPALPRALPVLVATGDADPICPADAVRALEGRGIRIAVVEGVDHGWWPGVERLETELSSFWKTLTPPLFYP